MLLLTLFVCSLGEAQPVSPPRAEQGRNEQISQPADLLPAPPSVTQTERSTPPAPPKAVPLAEALARRGDLTLRGNTLADALITISELWKINIVSGDVQGAVNGVFKDAPLREILDSILISNGFGYRAVGESLVVSDLGKLGQVNPYFESATILVTTADVNDVVAGAQLLSTPQGEVRAIPSASSVFVLDFPDRVKMIREFALSVDAAAQRASGQTRITANGVGPQQLQVAYMKTHYIPALSAEPVLQTVLSPAGRVAAMETEDRLLVVDYAENLQMVATVLQRIDRPRPQVSVRALIYDISLEDIESIGMNWQSLSGGDGGASVTDGVLTAGTASSGTGTLLNSLTVASPSADSVNGSFSFFTLNSNFSLSAVAVALQEAADSRLLASPNVTVVDNDEATIQSVSEIPFQQLTQTAGGGNIGTTAFRDAGVTLTVQPKIANDATIEMLVRPEFSRLTGFTSGDNQPIIDRRTAETRVRIANGQTFVIAGLRQRQDVGDFSGVPFLKDVRFFGHLFRSRSTDIRESELVVFISPRIVGPNDPLGPRSQVTADTVNCRLDHIPAAEGCPPGCGCADCQSMVAGPAPVEGYAAPTPAGSEAGPIPSESTELSYPEIGTRPKIRRLPAVEGSNADPYLASRQNATSDGRVRTAIGPSMRSGYDDRFRDANQAPTAEPSSSDSQATPEPKSLWRRVLLR